MVLFLVNLYIKGKYNYTCCTDTSGTIVFLYDYSGTDNQCEWQSLANTMEYISGNIPIDTGIYIYTDSLLLYKQLHGICRIKSKSLKPIYFHWNRYKNILMDYTIDYYYITGCENPARKIINERTNA